MLCVVVRAGAWCCVYALPGLRVARAPCPGVLLRRRGDTPPLWRVRMAPWRALLAPGCGPVRGSGMCVCGGWGGFLSRRLPSSCPAIPFRRPALHAHPFCTRWVGLGWLVGLGRLTWCFFPAGRRGLSPSWGVGRALVRSFGAPRRVYGVLGLLGPVHQCAPSLCCVACAVSWAIWFLFTGVHGLVCCALCAVSCPNWLLSTGVHALCAVLCVRCPLPLGSCSPVCVLVVLCCLCCVLSHLAPVHWCARSVCGVACAVSWPICLLFTGVLAWRVLCCVCGVLGHLAPVHRCACSVCCTVCVVSLVATHVFVVSCCLCHVLGHLAPVHRCVRLVCSVACAVSWATWLLLTGAHARCVVLRVQCPGPIGSCSPVCSRGVCCVVCAVSWATWLPCGVRGATRGDTRARSVVLFVCCPGPLGSCSPVCTLGVLCCVCGVLGHLAPVHRCVCLVCCAVCAVSWATWLLFTGVLAWRVLCGVCGVLGVHLAPDHRCACSMCCGVCAVSWAPWLLFTGVLAWRVLCCVCAVVGHLAPVHRCACSVCCAVFAVSWATLLLFTGVFVWCVVRCAWCPGPLGSCSPVCTLGVRCCVYGVLNHLAPVHRCACAVCCAVCAVSWATWLLFTGVLVWCVVRCARCPGPLGSCSPVCTLGVRCCVYGVLGLLAPVHQCACAVGCALWVVSWTTLLLFPGVLAWRVLCCVCGVLDHLAPVHLCACSVCCLQCGVLGHLAPVHRCARCVVWCVWSGCWCVSACAIPSSLHFSPRPRVGAVGVLFLGSCVHS